MPHGQKLHPQIQLKQDEQELRNEDSLHERAVDDFIAKLLRALRDIDEGARLF